MIDAGGSGGSDDEAEDEDADEAAKMEANAEGVGCVAARVRRKSRAAERKGGASSGASPRRTETESTSRKKPRRVFTGSGASLFIRRWAWKREAKSDEERFSRPYCVARDAGFSAGSAVPMGFDADDDDSSARTVTMRFAQRGFGDGGADGGFASTVWDSAIVLAKYVERHQEKFSRRSRVRLGAGCGVVSSRARRRRRVARRRHGPPGESPAVTREPPRQLRRGER